MTLANGTDRLRSARLLLRRIRPDDLPFFTRLHVLPEVAQGLYPEGRPRNSEETAVWLQRTLASYEQLSLGHLAVEREADGVLIGRCGLTELVVETATPEHGLRKGWFGRERVTAGARADVRVRTWLHLRSPLLGRGFRGRSGMLRPRLPTRRAALVLRGLGHPSA